MKLNAAQLRDIEPDTVEPHARELKRNPIYFVLDSVYDTYNVGGLFRLADALAIEKMYLCGEMETPPNARILKASIGTYKVVPWEYKATAVEAVQTLRQLHPTIKVYSVEQNENSVPYTSVEYTGPVALIVGNETYGVSPEAMAASDKVIEIPMWGINKSLNVIVSAAITSYWVADRLIEKPNSK